MSDLHFDKSDEKKTIVVVDDTADMVELLSEYLKFEGSFDVVSFTDPQQALRQVIWYPPDAVIVDLYMPKMSGIDFIKSYRDRVSEDMPPCLVLSGAHDEDSITKAYEAGAVDFLRKPLVKGELFAKLKHTLSQAARKQPKIAPNEPPAKIGDYEILEEVGRGGMGVVYKVRGGDGPSTNLALKAIWSRHDDTESLLRFRREIDLLSSFEHPSLVRIRGAGRQDSIYYYVMDYVNGKDLEWIGERMGAYKPGDVATLMWTLASALGYLHERGVVHRDIKPSNILLGVDRSITLVDFGLAKCFVDTQLTRHSDVLGTPAFMSPEVISGQGADHRSDLFSLGMVALEMLIGREVFSADNPFTIMLQITQSQYPKARDLAEVPESLAAIVDKLIECDPNDRFQKAEDLRAAISEEHRADSKLFA
jgi:CheY-like chemotaxis protein